MTADDQDTARRPGGAPPLLMALPDPAVDRTEDFRRSLAEVLRLLGVDVPAATYPDPYEEEQAARAAMREELDRRGVDQPGGSPQHGSAGRLPDPLFDALLRAAVDDPDPGSNRQFVAPARAAFGRRRVMTALIGYLRTGTDPHKAGAARAWYWTGAPLEYSNKEARVLTPESRAAWEAVADLTAQWQDAALREFVANDDLDVRRCLLPGLVLDASRRSGEVRPLVAEAVRIARTHPDAYLRHRVELQLG